MRRVLSILSLSALLVLGAAASATALVDTRCDDQDGDGYVPGGVCVESVDAEPYCDAEDLPALRYEVVLGEGSPDTGTVDIRWDNPSGTDVIYTDQPLVGSVPWPDAAWAQTEVRVLFDEVPVFVTAPECTGGAVLPDEQSSGGVVPAADGTSRSGVSVLSATGSDVVVLGLGAAAAVVLGGVAVTVSRRRRMPGPER